MKNKKIKYTLFVLFNLFMVLNFSPFAQAKDEIAQAKDENPYNIDDFDTNLAHWLFFDIYSNAYFSLDEKIEFPKKIYDKSVNHTDEVLKAIDTYFQNKKWEDEDFGDAEEMCYVVVQQQNNARTPKNIHTQIVDHCMKTANAWLVKARDEMTTKLLYYVENYPLVYKLLSEHYLCKVNSKGWYPQELEEFMKPMMDTCILYAKPLINDQLDKLAAEYAARLSDAKPTLEDLFKYDFFKLDRQELKSVSFEDDKYRNDIIARLVEKYNIKIANLIDEAKNNATNNINTLAKEAASSEDSKKRLIEICRNDLIRKDPGYSSFYLSTDTYGGVSIPEIKKTCFNAENIYLNEKVSVAEKNSNVKNFVNSRLIIIQDKEQEIEHTIDMKTFAWEAALNEFQVVYEKGGFF